MSVHRFGAAVTEGFGVAGSRRAVARSTSNTTDRRRGPRSWRRQQLECHPDRISKLAVRRLPRGVTDQSVEADAGSKADRASARRRGTDGQGPVRGVQVSAAGADPTPALDEAATRTSHIRQLRVGSAEGAAKLTADVSVEVTVAVLPDSIEDDAPERTVDRSASTRSGHDHRVDDEDVNLVGASKIISVRRSTVASATIDDPPAPDNTTDGERRRSPSSPRSNDAGRGRRSCVRAGDAQPPGIIKHQRSAIRSPRPKSSRSSSPTRAADLVGASVRGLEPRCLAR